MSERYLVASWNLENLFDHEQAPRTDKLQRALGRSIKGWTERLRDRKVARLASIIQGFGSGTGPDILAVCEVENRAVLELLCGAVALPGRDYGVVHHDSPDQRGIDVAFIYDKKRFTTDKVFSHFVMRRTATRDILQVTFVTRQGRKLVLMANHWPSRSGGRYESAAYRAMAGETLAYFHQRSLETDGKETPVMAMGDFNDEPFDVSVLEHALAARSKLKVTNTTSAPRFLNLMWRHADTGLGTYYYQNWPNLLDQCLVNKNLVVRERPIRVVEDSIEIVRDPRMVAGGEYEVPRPFGGMGKDLDEDGYSDHFPIAVTLEEDD